MHVNVCVRLGEGGGGGSTQPNIVRLKQNAGNWRRPLTSQQYKTCCQKPGHPGCFQDFLERSKEPVGRHFSFSTMEESSRTGELEKPPFPQCVGGGAEATS